ncbi:hypothetical protein D3C71_441340 [compost metagenome]
MKPFLTLTLMLLVISAACNSEKKHEGKADYLSNKKEISKNIQTDSIQLINKCENDVFVSELRENINLDSNGYILTIKFKDGLKKVTHRLNLPPGKGQINYCLEDYTVVGASCGGPCYSQVFIFTKEKRPNEQFDYCQRITSHPNLIAHIEDEKFEELIIHNFDTGKELKIDIPDNNYWCWGQMDTLFMVKNDLVVKYTSKDKKLKQKTISLQKILK